jgi:hypothetical protein
MNPLEKVLQDIATIAIMNGGDPEKRLRRIGDLALKALYPNEIQEDKWDGAATSGSKSSKATSTDNPAKK